MSDERGSSLPVSNQGRRDAAQESLRLRPDPLQELARIMEETEKNLREGGNNSPFGDQPLNPADLLDRDLRDRLADAALRDLQAQFPADQGQAYQPTDEDADFGLDDRFFQDDMLADDLLRGDAAADLMMDETPFEQAPANFLADLDFSDDADLTGRFEPATAQPPADPDPAPPVASFASTAGAGLAGAGAAAIAAVPNLSAHMTSRPASATATSPKPTSRTAPAQLDENALLAALDDLALDDDLPPDPVPVRSASHASDAPAMHAAERRPIAQPTSSAAEAASGGGARKMVFALAGLGMLALAGIVAYGVFAGADSTGDAPQVIAANPDPDKVEPDAPAEQAAQPGDAVFQALDGSTPATPAGPRVILPAPAATGVPAQIALNENGVQIAPAAPGSTAVRPVRTVTVRADGSVIEAAPANTAQTEAQSASQAAADLQVPAAQARPVEVIAVTPNAVAAPVLDAATANPALAPALDAIQPSAAQPSAGSGPAVPQPVARPGGLATAPLAAPAIQPIAAAPVQPFQQVQPGPLAQPVTGAQPIQLAAPAAAPAQPVTQPAAALPASVPSGDFVVQLASLRSPEQAQATFNTLQGRFGSLLGGFAPNVQQVDLGDRGIYHRLRVGPMDRAAADSLCARFQSAGGDCLVQRQ